MGKLARSFVAACLASLVPNTARAAEPPPIADDSFRDDTGVVRPFRETYRESYRLGRREPHYLRAALSNVAVIGLGLGWYWYKKDVNKVDWDYPNIVEKFKHLEVTFDTNPQSTNQINHPFGGALFYSTARLNGIGVAGSFGYASLSSIVYETFGEWKEKPSINDLIFTPVGGMAIGEFFVRLGDYAHSAPNGGRTIHKVMSWPLGLLHHIYPAKRSIDTLPPDALGYSSYFGHRFDVMLGTSWTSNNLSDSSTLQTIAARAEIVSMPGFLKPGKFSKSFVDGNFVEARGMYGFGKDNQFLLDLLFDSNLAGHYAQDIEGCGTAWMLALNTSLRYYNRNILDRRDFYGIAHLLGPELKLWAVSGAFTAKLEGTAHADFAGIRALPYHEWTDANGAEGTRSILQAQTYDWHYGGSARARGTLAYHDLELTTEAFGGLYGSVDRWDRFEERVTKNIHIAQQIFEFHAYLAWKVPAIPLQLRVYGDHLGRSSEMAPFTVNTWDRRFGVELGLRL